MALRPVSTTEYLQCLFRLWPTEPLPARLGLAVSGGVDSMALSHLTHRLAEEANISSKLSLHAFIVDHRYRPGSSFEATEVAEILRSWGFNTHILPLSWGSSGPDTTAFETKARKLRYVALAQACIKNDIKRLFLAHHGDDQAETVMMRMVRSSKFEGLAGMKEIAPVPECWGIWGADKIVVGRPLLRIQKKRLIETCKVSSIPWREDHTNWDPTYTPRNAVRSLLTKSPSPLPAALQTPSLIALAARAEARNRDVKSRANQLLSHCNIALNTKVGSLSFSIPSKLWKHVEDKVLIRLLIQISEIVSPQERVESKSMFSVFSRIFTEVPSSKTFNAAGLIWNYNACTWTLRRQPHSDKSRELAQIIFPAGTCNWTWSPWKLFDGRWWIRVYNLYPDEEVLVRALNAQDMKYLRTRSAVVRKSLSLEKAMKGLPGDSRFTLPLVVARKDGKEEMLGLPTLGVYVGERESREGRWAWKFKSGGEEKRKVGEEDMGFRSVGSEGVHCE